MAKKSYQLIQHPWISVSLVLFLYILTLILSDVFIMILSSKNQLFKLAIKFSLFSMLCFVIIPFVLKLPKGENSIRDYFSNIGLIKTQPTTKLIFIFLTCYIFFAISQLSGTLIFHATQTANYVFDISRNSLLNTGTIISGIFEEIIFRGIILTLLLNHYSERKSILLSAVVFSCIHALNVLNPQLNVFWVFSQVIWSLGFGIMYGYIFVKTKSIIPLILLHYFINGMVNVWFYGLDKNDFNSAVYGIPFYGIIPSILVILWYRYYWENKKVQIG